MANIHRLNADGRPANQRPLLGADTDEEQNLFTNPFGQNQDPRNETFCDMLRYSLQIRLRKCSVILILLLILYAMFAAQLAVDGIDRSNIDDPTKSSFLQVNVLGPFTYSLAAVGHFVKQGQVWRVLTALGLHADLPHIFANSISTIILGSFLTIFFSDALMLIIILASGLAGNLYSFCWMGPQSIGVGFSTSVCGMAGAILGYLIFNWKNMASAVNTRCSLLMTVVWGFLFSVSFSAARQVSPQGGKQIGNAAHFGGYVAGVFIAMAVAPVYKNANVRSAVLIRYMFKAKMAGAILFFLFVVGSLGTFLVRDKS